MATVALSTDGVDRCLVVLRTLSSIDFVKEESSERFGSTSSKSDYLLLIGLDCHKGS